MGGAEYRMRRILKIEWLHYVMDVSAGQPAYNVLKRLRTYLHVH